MGDDAFWYKDAVIYELHVKSFADSDGDGIGDFKGLTAKLDYLQELGVSALWLLPFYPSPLKDDGYDIGHYTEVNPSYGTIEDFKEFLAEAHRRGLRVITELVINHTSDQHAWFQRARRAPKGSPERDFYVWSDDPTKYSETRIIFTDYEPSNWTWDPVADQYFWHRFFHHQPDLNFDNPAVHEELLRVMDFWMEMGVDGMRLDAIPYLYEREGTNCENLPETHVYLKTLRAHVDAKWPGRMLLAEANQWPEDAAQYFGDGDECHMNFHFPLMPRLFMALRMEDRFPILDILEQTPAIPANSQWAIFLRNHDELTLEMVTDEERDYMRSAYAADPAARINLGIRRRLAPLLQNHRRKVELMNSLLLSLPGTPVLYYGDEIGMGDNFYLGDRHGVRTPMQWSSDRNAGFSRANPQKLFLPIIIDPEYHYESVNVEAQHENPSSLLWWTRRLLALRRRHQAFGRGDFRWVEHANKRVLVYTRTLGDETLLIVVNLSRFSQAVELELKEFEGAIPIELFGHSAFPAIGELPYLLTVGPHSFYWFRLHQRGAAAEAGVPTLPEKLEELPLIETTAGWETLLEQGGRATLRQRLIGWLAGRRWFGGKGRTVRAVTLGAAVPIPLEGGGRAQLVVVHVDYVASEGERYLLPIAFTSAAEAYNVHHRHPGSVICRVASAEGVGVLHDAASVPGFGRALLALIAQGGRLGSEPALSGLRYGAIEIDPAVEPKVGTAEQSNTSIVYGDRTILKLLRRVDDGVNLDREIGLALGRVGFPATPPVLGALELRTGRRAATVGVLQAFVPNQGDAWTHTLETIDGLFERALAAGADPDPGAPPATPLLAAVAQPIPPHVEAALGAATLESMRLLGRRTAEMHLALASVDEPDFRPEPFTTLYQRSLYQAERNLVGQTFETLTHARPRLDEDRRRLADRILSRKADLLARFRTIIDRRIEGARIRIHGDYHLGQVLWTGKDFVVIDFEGEPIRPLSERRLRRSALRDVAGMLRSFHYASAAALRRASLQGIGTGTDAQVLERWVRFWHRWVSVAFVQGYQEGIGKASFLPDDPAERQILLDVYLLEKAVYELGYELANRPDWADIPAEGILDLIGPAPVG